MAVTVKALNKGEQLSKVKQIEWLTDSAYIIRFDRNNTDFIPGQHLTLSKADSLVAREYSIFSGIYDDYFEVLIKLVIDGTVSQQLKTLESGKLIRVGGPYGQFCLPEQAPENRKYLFVATGTGIAPFHSMVKSYPWLNYTIYHGVRYKNEAYGSADFDPERYHLCVSGEPDANLYGRVTKFIESAHISPDTYCYLSGNSNMIFDVYNLLRKKQIPVKQIFTEVYF